MAGAYVAVMTLKGGRVRRERFDGENAQARAQEFGKKEKANCPAVQSVRVMKASEDDKRKHLKPGDPGYTGSEKDTKTFAEQTSADFFDGHTHEVVNVDTEGNGETAEAGQPPHKHEIKGGMVVPMGGGEGDDKYLSHHPGEVVRGAEETSGDDKGNKRAEPTDEQNKLIEQAERAAKEKIMKLKLGELKNIEIFATGNHRGREFTEEHIDKILENFERFGDKVKSPLVLGHGENQEILENSGLPSLGRVTSLHKEDKGDKSVLVADFEDVPEMARTVINQKKYNRISSEIYEDFQDEGKGHGLALRRVALLGADIPEVKTLADVAAMGEGGGTFLLSEGIEGGADMPKSHTTDPKVLEKIKKLEEDNKKLAGELAKESLAKHRQGIASFCEDMKEKGKLLPAWEVMGLRKFMETLEPAKTLKFAEGDDAQELSPLAFFQEFVKALPEIVKMEEIANADPTLVAQLKKKGATGDKNTALDMAARKLMSEEGKAGRTLTYTEAIKRAGRENPALVEEV